MGDIGEMVGVVLVSVDGLEPGSEGVSFRSACGRRWWMYHERDCCEDVQVEDVSGDVRDLLGVPLLRAEEVSGGGAPDGFEDDGESHTWTYYKLGTVKGDVDVRWHGTSNGYYSESVDFREVTGE